MYTAHITMTGKGYSPKDQFRISGEDRVMAGNLKELKARLASRYGKSWKHKRPMYCDKKDGSTVRTGWVIGFRVNNGPGEKYLQQDWVSIVEVEKVEW